MGENNREVTSLGHWFFLKPRQLKSLVTHADVHHLLTWDVISQQEKHFTYYTCTKIKWCLAPITPPASFHRTAMPANACSPPDIMTSGDWEENAGWRGDGWYKCAQKEPSHVTWWKRMYCGASAGQNWFVMLFVLCLLILCFPLFYLSLHSYNVFGMLKFTPHCPAHPKGLTPCNYSLILHLYFTNAHLRMLSFVEVASSIKSFPFLLLNLQKEYFLQLQ